MEITCKGIKLYESSYRCLGGWDIDTFNLDFYFEFEGEKVNREIVWRQEKILFPKLFIRNEKKLIKAMKESVKEWFGLRKSDIANKKYQQEINLIIDGFNDKHKEITFRI